MWTDQHNAPMDKFLRDTSQQLLLVYIDQHSGLSFCTSLPVFQVEEIAYFARDENAEINARNFTKVVQFGTVKGNYVNGLLRAMHDLYAPTFFENQTWPDSIQKHNFFFFANFHFGGGNFFF